MISTLTQGYGGAESDYRPGRWKSFREDYRFTGKEEDVEVGLQYFGKRFLNPLLGRWVSADPLAVHAPGEADLNLYAYVSGAVLKNVDPLGLEEEAVNVGGGGDIDDPAPSELDGALVQDVRVRDLEHAAKEQLPRFDTQEDAAKSALEETNQASITEDRETGGILLKLEDGAFSYTHPIGSTERSTMTAGFGDWVTSHPLLSLPSVSYAGWFHTHGSSSGSEQAEVFSESDVAAISATGGDAQIQPAYLATPLNRMKILDLVFSIHQQDIGELEPLRFTFPPVPSQVSQQIP